MVKFISDIMDSVVILFQERIKVGTVKELIVNPDDGFFLGFVVSQYSKEDDKVVLLKNVKGFGNGIVMIDEYGALSDFNDIVEIEKTYPNNPEILKAKVVTESDQKIGKVADATVSLDSKKLEKIYVEPNLSVRFLSNQLIIPKNKIVKIEKKKIIVSDEFIAVKDKKVGVAQAAAID